jgi:hypothetical protein
MTNVPTNQDIVQELASQQSGYPYFYQWNQIQGNFGVEPGRVFIDDFDLGVLKTMGAILDPGSPADEPSFVLQVKGLKPEEQRQIGPLGGDVVPVTFGHPEAFMSTWQLPGVFVRREGLEPDLARYSQDLESFRKVAPNTEIVEGQETNIVEEGPAEVMQRQRAEAYNFIYIIDCIARYRTDANALLRAVLPKFKQNMSIIVRDSLGDLNQYTAFLEGITDLQEVLGVTMKHIGYSIQIKVIGELDLYPDNVVIPTAKIIEPDIVVKDPTVLSPVPTTTDGLVLKTYPSKVLGRICSHVKVQPISGGFRIV